MLDRFLKLIIAGTLALFFVQAVIGVLARVVEAALHGLLSRLGTVGGYLGQLVIGAAAVSLVVGLLVRAVQWVREKGSSRRSGQGQGAHDWASRSSADEVPVDRPRTRPSRHRTRRRG